MTATPEETTETSIEFTLYDALGPDQVSEQVIVMIDDRIIGTLTVNDTYPEALIQATLPEEGSYSYTIDVSLVFFDKYGQLWEYTTTESGWIDITSDSVLAVMYAWDGETWIYWLEPY